MNQAVAKLVRCHARQAELGVLDQRSDRRALGREQNPAEGMPCRCHRAAISRKSASCVSNTRPRAVARVSNSSSDAPPMTAEEIEAEIKAYRAARRGAANA